MENPRLIFFLLFFLPLTARAQFRYDLTYVRVSSEKRMSSYELNQVDRIITEHRKKLDSLYPNGEKIPGKPTVRFYPSTPEFTQALGTVWQVGGVYREGVIHLQPVEVLKRRDSLETLLRHEYAHYFLEQKYSGMPGYLNEGLSAYDAGLYLERVYPLLWENLTNENSGIFVNASGLDRYLSSARYFTAYLRKKYSPGEVESYLNRGNWEFFRREYGEFYYQNAGLIRVLLKPSSQKRFMLRFNRPATVTLELANGGEKTLAEQEQVHIDISGEKIVVNDWECRRAVLRGGNGFTYEKKDYRGDMEITRADNETVFLNILPVEHYLYSVVGSEMPSIDPEALKLQAVLSRSWAYYQINSRRDESYHVSMFTADQAYRGLEWETEATRSAVKETDGLVLTYEGKVVTPFYSSTCAGHTALAEDIWNTPVPYVQAVPCQYCASSPHFGVWENKISQQDLNRIFGQKVIVLKVEEQGRYGRVRSVRVNDTVYPFEVFKRMIAKEKGWFMLKSNLVEIEKLTANGDSDYVFRGKGLGHGIGLCQYGAMTLCQTHPFPKVINYYFQNLKLETVLPGYRIYQD